MAVYTEVSDEALAAFLADYDIGSVVAFRGIAEGVENSNFSLRTTAGDFILTLYEKRVDPADLPWFLGLMEHLATRGIVCPLPVRGARRRGAAELVRPPRRDHHLPARRLAAPGAAGALRPGRRRAGGRCTWPARTTRRRGATRWAGRLAAAAGPLPATGRTRCCPAWRPSWMRRWRRSWPPGRPGCRSATSTPTCSPTTYSSWTGGCPGLIDFYFAATDIWPTTWRSASTPGASSRTSPFNVTKARAMLAAYEARPAAVGGGARRAAGAVPGRGDALPADPAVRLAATRRRARWSPARTRWNICAGCASTSPRPTSMPMASEPRHRPPGSPEGLGGDLDRWRLQAESRARAAGAPILRYARPRARTVAAPNRRPPTTAWS